MCVEVMKIAGNPTCQTQNAFKCSNVQIVRTDAIPITHLVEKQNENAVATLANLAKLTQSLP